MRGLLALVVMAFAALGCFFPMTIAGDTVSTGHEVETLLAYSGGVFEPDLWRIASAEETATDSRLLYRRIGQEDLLFFFTYYHFDPSATQPQVDAFFDADTFAILLSNYRPYREIDRCTQDGLTLVEFVTNADATQKRMLRYWYRLDTERRVLGVNGVAPADSEALLDEYAARLFPDLPSCAAAE